MWSGDIKDFYEPVKILGKGGFGDVWLGKAISESKNQEEKHEGDSVIANGKGDTFVAIKSIDTSTATGSAFAQREVKILQLLDHPHIVKLFNVFESKNPPSTFLAITYANGPTLEKVIEVGGALSIPLAQLVAKQLVHAVAYLHTHAVLHRDLKPDNVVITGATLQDDFLWDNEDEAQKVVDEGKLHIMLLDFGFSRALQKEDIMTDAGLYKAMEEDEKGAKLEYKENPDISKETRKSLNRSMNGSGRDTDRSGRLGRSFRGRGRTLDRSISHARVRDLSALGSRNYAAPEVVNGAHKKPKQKPREMLDRSSSRRGRKARKEALTDCIADYGMDADAYSLGATLRYALTGVPPGNNVAEYIAAQNSVFRKFGSKLGKKLKKKKGDDDKKEKKRTKRYRTIGQCPKGATLLLRDLTSGDPMKRATVRSARYYPWIITDDESEIAKLGRSNNVTFLKME